MDDIVLIIDDDKKLQDLLEEYFKEFGFKVYSIYEGRKACDRIRALNPDIIILDIMLPGIDGFEVLREIRKDFEIPVIMLTARGAEEDRIVGLEMGADDYLSKPFNPRELLARIKAIFRRTGKKGDADKKTPGGIKGEKNLIKAGGLVLNRSKRTLLIKNEEIELSSTEFSLLEALMKSADTVLSRDQLMNMTKGRDFLAFDRSIDVHISKIRAKLQIYPEFQESIKTVWGIGYMFITE